MDLLPQLIGMGIFSPVDVEVTDPLGRVIAIHGNEPSIPEFPAIMTEEDGEKQLLFPFVPGLPYTVNLTGIAGTVVGYSTLVIGAGFLYIVARLSGVL